MIFGSCHFCSSIHAMQPTRSDRSRSECAKGVCRSFVARHLGEMKLETAAGEVAVVMSNMNPGVDQAESGMEWLVDSNRYSLCVPVLLQSGKVQIPGYISASKSSSEYPSNSLPFFEKCKSEKKNKL